MCSAALIILNVLVYESNLIKSKSINVLELRSDRHKSAAIVKESQSVEDQRNIYCVHAKFHW